VLTGGRMRASGWRYLLIFSLSSELAILYHWLPSYGEARHVRSISRQPISRGRRAGPLHGLDMCATYRKLPYLSHGQRACGRIRSRLDLQLGRVAAGTAPTCSAHHTQSTRRTARAGLTVSRRICYSAVSNLQDTVSTPRPWF
jgi:hypothetical protein